MNRPAPLQFGLRSMLVLTGVMGVLFATLNWLDVPPLASSIVLVVLVVSVVAAVGLVAVIAQAEGRERKAEGGRRKNEE